MKDNERWVISFYRNSEITGALFFGQLARYIPDDGIRENLTSHFADESQHARYWTNCLNELGSTSVRISDAYQNRYFQMIGIPTNMMEILAITRVFELRTIRQYRLHRTLPGIQPQVQATIDKIMQDEQWHLRWVNAELMRMKLKFGAERVEETLRRYDAADREIYRSALAEYQDRLTDMFGHFNFEDEEHSDEHV